MTVLMGADIPGAEPMRSAYLTLSVDSAEEAERLYALLSDGGQIFMKMEETFFASRFAQLRDKFGTSWMLLRERQAAPRPSGKRDATACVSVLKGRASGRGLTVDHVTVPR